MIWGGGDSNLYGYILGVPVDFVDPDGKFAWLIPIGLYFLLRDNYLNAPDMDEVGLVCFTTPLYKTPDTLYHFTTKKVATRILESGLKIGGNNLYGIGVYATRYNSRIMALLQGATSTEPKIIISNTSRFHPTFFPRALRTRGLDVPVSHLVK